MNTPYWTQVALTNQTGAPSKAHLIILEHAIGNVVQYHTACGKLVKPVASDIRAVGRCRACKSRKLG